MGYSWEAESERLTGQCWAEMRQSQKASDLEVRKESLSDPMKVIQWEQKKDPYWGLAKDPPSESPKD